MITVQTKPFPGRPCHEYRCFLDCGLNGPVNIDHKLLRTTRRGRRVDKLNKTYSMCFSDHWRKRTSTAGLVSEKRREVCSCKFWEYEARFPRKSSSGSWPHSHPCNMRSSSRGWLWSSALIWPRSSTRMLGIGSSVYLELLYIYFFWGALIDATECLGCKIQNNSPPSPPPHCLPISSASKCRPTFGQSQQSVAA